MDKIDFYQESETEAQPIIVKKGGVCVFLK